jgi:hypothetical protein
MNSYPRSIDDEVQESFVVCTLCLRVLRGSSWVEAEKVIREVRSFELTSMPSLLNGLCSDCSEMIRLRRGEAQSAAAA